MENEAQAYAVLLSTPASYDPMALAKALAAVRKTPLQDQVFVAKNCRGILSENVSAEGANALVQALSQSGFKCQISRMSSIPALPQLEEAATKAALPAANPILISTAAITLSSTTTRSVKEGPSAAQKILSTGILLTTGLPIHLGGKDRTVKITQHHSDLIFYLDLIYKDPSRRFRIDARKFDYSFLKERKLYDIFGNFKLLVGDFVKGAPEVWQNHGTRVMLEGKPIQSMGYNSLEDLDRESRWLLTLYRHSGESRNPEP